MNKIKLRINTDPTPGLGSLIIPERGVLKQLSSLNAITWFLKTFATDISPILTDVLLDSIDSGTVARRWNEANVHMCSF